MCLKINIICKTSSVLIKYILYSELICILIPRMLYISFRIYDRMIVGSLTSSSEYILPAYSEQEQA